jgi:hypothetical protein
MADDKKPVKKGANPLLFVGIGCLVLFVILAIVGSIAVFLSGAIESKTGIKTNLSDVENGKFSFTDEKTGAKVDIGTDKLPDSFPKDFPVYPGAKVTGVLSGSEQGKSTGAWITFTTADSKDKVAAFYKTNLKSNGWTDVATYASGDTVTQTVSKGTMSGTVGITRAADEKETEIIVMLGVEKAAQDVPVTSEPVSEE